MADAYTDPDTGIELVTVWSAEMEKLGLAPGLSSWQPNPKRKAAPLPKYPVVPRRG